MSERMSMERADAAYKDFISGQAEEADWDALADSALQASRSTPGWKIRMHKRGVALAWGLAACLAAGGLCFLASDNAARHKREWSLMAEGILMAQEAFQDEAFVGLDEAVEASLTLIALNPPE